MTDNNLNDWTKTESGQQCMKFPVPDAPNLYNRLRCAYDANRKSSGIQKTTDNENKYPLIGDDRMLDLIEENKRLKDQVERLENFKKYVHDRLDEMGVPTDPDPENNKKTGCRIEGRLNYIVQRMSDGNTLC